MRGAVAAILTLVAIFVCVDAANARSMYCTRHPSACRHSYPAPSAADEKWWNSLTEAQKAEKRKETENIARAVKAWLDYQSEVQFRLEAARDYRRWRTVLAWLAGLVVTASVVGLLALLFFPTRDVEA